MTDTIDDLRYPVGRFQRPAEFTDDLRRTYIAEIAATPALVREAIAGLDGSQLGTHYRDGGWSVAQVVHHFADSHIHAYTRCKMALTEDAPVIKGYSEAAWALLPDAQSTDPADLDASLRLLEALHARWVATLRGLTPDQWVRAYEQPPRTRTVELTAAIYAWHGRHHVAHIRRLRERMHW